MNAALRLVYEEYQMLSIPLGSAQLCPETTCEEIFALSDETCPKCHSAGLPLERLLNDRADYSPLVAAVRDVVILGARLNVGQRQRLVDALRVAGVSL